MQETCREIIAAMGGQAQVATSEKLDALVSVRLLSDPAGKIEVPAVSRLFLAIHVGRSVYMTCERGGQRHRSLYVHGDMDIVPPRTPSIWEPEEIDTALIISMNPRVVNNAAEELGLDAKRVEIFNRFQIRDSQIENIGWALKAEMEAGFPGGRLFTDGLATALATSLVLRHSSHSAVPRKKVNGGIRGKRLRDVLSYIEDNLASDLAIEDIARMAGVGVSHFKASFRLEAGMPVHQYVIRRRIERAKSLLRAGQLSIIEIAHDCGFANQSHLAKHMRRLAGCSPKQFRDTCE